MRFSEKFNHELFHAAGSGCSSGTMTVDCFRVKPPWTFLFGPMVNLVDRSPCGMWLWSGHMFSFVYVYITMYIYIYDTCVIYVCMYMYIYVWYALQKWTNAES
jgi:hypothetical protein